MREEFEGILMHADFLHTEELDSGISRVKRTFDDFQALHKGINWSEVEESLRASPKALERIDRINCHGHYMTVFEELEDAFVFASAWNDYRLLSEEHKDICFDSKGFHMARQEGYRLLSAALNSPGRKGLTRDANRLLSEGPKGVAIKIIAELLEIDENEAQQHLADEKYHLQLANVTKIRGRAWLKTDEEAKEWDSARLGQGKEVITAPKSTHGKDLSLRIKLKVNKVQSSE